MSSQPAGRRHRRWPGSSDPLPRVLEVVAGQRPRRQTTSGRRLSFQVTVIASPLCAGRRRRRWRWSGSRSAASCGRVLEVVVSVSRRVPDERGDVGFGDLTEVVRVELGGFLPVADDDRAAGRAGRGRVGRAEQVDRRRRGGGRRAAAVTVGRRCRGCRGRRCRRGRRGGAGTAAGCDRWPRPANEPTSRFRINCSSEVAYAPDIAPAGPRSGPLCSDRARIAHRTRTRFRRANTRPSWLRGARQRVPQRRAGATSATSVGPQGPGASPRFESRVRRRLSGAPP